MDKCPVRNKACQLTFVLPNAFPNFRLDNPDTHCHG